MEFKTGDRVKIISLKKEAIFKKVFKKELATVTLGSMELKIPISDLELTSKNSNQQKPKKQNKKQIPIKTSKKKLVLDYHGFTKASCLNDLEEKLSQAFLGNITEITVIHGRGQGILKNAIINYLSSLTLRMTFRSSATNENEIIINILG